MVKLASKSVLNAEATLLIVCATIHLDSIALPFLKVDKRHKQLFRSKNALCCTGIIEANYRRGPPNGVA